MAIYRLEVKSISRGQGRSCVAAASYRHAGILLDERQGLTHDYSRKGGVLHSEIIAPDDATDWTMDRQSLWNRLDAAEKRRDAITAREVLLTLPRELSQDQQIKLVRSFVREQFTPRGIVADIAVHAPHALDGEEQPHAHVMLADRTLDPAQPNGLASRKDRTLAGPEGIHDLRQAWERHANRALEHAGLDQRLDCRSLADQADAALKRSRDPAQPEHRRSLALADAAALDRDPEPKIGPVAMRMHRQGRGDQAHALKRVLVVRDERSALDRARDYLRERVAALEPWMVFARDLTSNIAHRVAEKERHAREWLALPLQDKLDTICQVFDTTARKERRPEFSAMARRHGLNADLHGAMAEGFRQASKPGAVNINGPIATAERLDDVLEHRIRLSAMTMAANGNDDTRRVWTAVADHACDDAIKDTWLKLEAARRLDPLGKSEDARKLTMELLRTGMKRAGIPEIKPSRDHEHSGPGIKRRRDRGPEIDF